MSTRGSERYSENEDLWLELKRQTFHLILISLWVLPIHLFPRNVTFLTFVLVLGLNLLVLFRVKPFYGAFLFLIVHLERKKNLDRPGIQALYANLGIFTSYLLFGELSTIGVLVLAVGDSLSTLVGKLLGKTPIFFNPNKSWEGTLSFFLGTFPVLCLLSDPRGALTVSVLSALTEALPLTVDDNLTLPVTATFLAYLVW